MAHVPLSREPTGLDYWEDLLHATSIGISKAGWFFPTLKNFFDTFNHLMQAAQNVKSTNAGLLSLARDVKDLLDVIGKYAPTIGTVEDSAYPFDPILQDTTILLRDTIDKILIWKQNNSLIHRLTDKNRIHRLMENRFKKILRQMDKVKDAANALYLSKVRRDDGLPTIYPHEIHFKGTNRGIYLGQVRVVRRYAPGEKRRMEWDIFWHHIIRDDPHLPRILGVSDCTSEMPFVMYETIPFSSPITSIAEPLFRKHDSPACVMLVSRIILDLGGAVEHLQRVGFLRTIRQLRCALKPGNVVVTSTGWLVFFCDWGEYCAGKPGSCNDPYEDPEFRRVLVEFCLTIRPDSVSLLGEQETKTTALEQSLNPSTTGSTLYQTLGKLVFDAELNATSWKHSAEKSGLPTQIMTPSTCLGPSFDQYCTTFLPSRKPYETSSLYSDAPWIAGDVLCRANGVTQFLCNVADHYRTEEFPPHVVKAGAHDREGSQEDVIFDKEGHKLTRYSFEAAETVDFVQYSHGRRRLFNHDLMAVDLWPVFRSLLPSVARDWDAPPSELVLVIGEGKGIVRAKYEAPPPTLEDGPRKTVYLFVPEDEQAAPSWSFSPLRWLDSPKVEGAWCERCPSVHFLNIVSAGEQAKIIHEAECGAMVCQEQAGDRLPNWHSESSCTVGGCTCRYPPMPPHNHFVHTIDSTLLCGCAVRHTNHYSDRYFSHRSQRAKEREPEPRAGSVRFGSGSSGDGSEETRPIPPHEMPIVPRTLRQNAGVQFMHLLRGMNVQEVLVIQEIVQLLNGTGRGANMITSGSCPHKEAFCLVIEFGD